MPSSDKDEWLFLAAVSSFASSTQGIVSPSAEELCGTLGTEIGRLQQERATVRDKERDSKKRRETVKGGAAWMVSASTMKKNALPNNNLCSYVMYIYSLGCLYATVNPAGGIVCHYSQSNNTKGRQGKEGGWSRMWGRNTEGTEEILMKYRNN